MADFKYEIIEEIGVLSENAKGWRKELNKISWNGGVPKYDIRDWAPEHEKMGKGVTLTDEEAACTIRISFDSQNNYGEINELAKEISYFTDKFVK